MAVLAGFLCSSCDFISGWRDSQIETSHRLATQTDELVPPETPIEIPVKYLRELPVDDTFTICDYTATKHQLRIKAISAWDTANTAAWIHGRAVELGYSSADNPSRILEGVTYKGTKGRYRRLIVKVTLNTSDQCVVNIEGYRE